MLSMLGMGTEEFAAGSSLPDLGICFLSTDFGIPEYYQITVVGLIALLGMKEMLLVSSRRRLLFDRFHGYGNLPSDDMFYC